MSNHDVTFVDVIHTYFLNFWTSQFLYRFDRNIQGKLKAEKNFYQYLEYKLRFDILNLDNLLLQKRGTPL